MSASSESTPDVRPTSARLATVIDAAPDGVGLVERGQLVLANCALTRTTPNGPAALVRVASAAPSGAPSTARLESASGTITDLVVVPFDAFGHASRAVFTAVDGVERLLALAASLRSPDAALPRTPAVVRDLIAFTPELDAAPDAIDVAAELERVLEAARAFHGDRVEFVPRFGRVPRVLAHESRLAHALWNVLANAAEAFAAKPGAAPRVGIALRSEGPNVVIEVSDTGAGIAEDDLPRVFDAFFTTKPDRAGLGLTASRHIVAAARGELRLQSVRGEGSAARITLPAAEKRVSTIPPPGGGARLLIIDDEPLLGQTLKFAFSGRHDVTIASSGREALRVLSEEDPNYDLVLCDLMMPDLPGQRVFEAVERDHPALLPRFFFMTGGAFTDSAQAFLERHPDRRIDKPFTISDIERLLLKIR